MAKIARDMGRIRDKPDRINIVRVRCKDPIKISIAKARGKDTVREAKGMDKMAKPKCNLVNPEMVKMAKDMVKIRDKLDRINIAKDKDMVKMARPKVNRVKAQTMTKAAKIVNMAKPNIAHKARVWAMGNKTNMAKMAMVNKDKANHLEDNREMVAVTGNSS